MRISQFYITVKAEILVHGKPVVVFLFGMVLFKQIHPNHINDSWFQEGFIAVKQYQWHESPLHSAQAGQRFDLLPFYTLWTVSDWPWHEGPNFSLACQHLPSCYPCEYNQPSCILCSILPNTSPTFSSISHLPSSLPTMYTIGSLLTYKNCASLWKMVSQEKCDFLQHHTGDVLWQFIQHLPVTEMQWDKSGTEDGIKPKGNPIIQKWKGKQYGIDSSNGGKRIPLPAYLYGDILPFSFRCSCTFSLV